MFTLTTSNPIATDSLDHIVPRGTRNDNTHCAEFVLACEAFFRKRPLRFLDLGCSGGGLVVDFLDRGHLALGLEGSDYSLQNNRAEWPRYPEALKTCDITKPFVVQEDGAPAQFEVISAWEVMEHIRERDLPQLLRNIESHLSDLGIFVCSVASGIDRTEAGDYHVTVKPEEWWKDLFLGSGFDILGLALFSGNQWPRGPGSRINDPGFHFVLERRI